MYGRSLIARCRPPDAYDRDAVVWKRNPIAEEKRRPGSVVHDHDDEEHARRDVDDKANGDRPCPEGVREGVIATPEGSQFRHAAIIDRPRRPARPADGGPADLNLQRRSREAIGRLPPPPFTGSCAAAISPVLAHGSRRRLRLPSPASPGCVSTDRAAAVAAIAPPWSNGQAEGDIRTLTATRWPGIRTIARQIAMSRPAADRAAHHGRRSAISFAVSADQGARDLIQKARGGHRQGAPAQLGRHQRAVRHVAPV